MMKAVVKAKAEPGLWLEEVPVPNVDSDDVLIRVLKASICGTDVHIYNWDDWAQKTIPVPMTIGHEFVGAVEAVGDHVKGFAKGDLWTLSELSGRAASPLPKHTGRWRQSPRRVGGVRSDSAGQLLACRSVDSAGGPFLFRPVRQCRAYCTLVRSRRRRRAHYWGWADRLHGHSDLQTSRCASRRDHGRESVSSRSCAKNGR